MTNFYDNGDSFYIPEHVRAYISNFGEKNIRFRGERSQMQVEMFSNIIGRTTDEIIELYNDMLASTPNSIFFVLQDVQKSVIEEIDYNFEEIYSNLLTFAVKARNADNIGRVLSDVWDAVKRGMLSREDAIKISSIT